MTNNAPRFNLATLCEATNGRAASLEERTVQGVSTDSRSVTAGMLYVALKGERFDGHDFAAEAFNKGAATIMTERLCEGVPPECTVLVEDCYKALQQLAGWYRQHKGFTVVGVTGSAGKTSTKEMLALAIGAEKKAHATQGNLNNHIGVPLTILNTPEQTEVLILEMGMNHAGEIHLLSTIGKPDIAVITTVDAAHLEFFENIEGIARAKAEIMDGMAKGTPIILPADNPYFPILLGIATDKELLPVLFGEHSQADYALKQVRLNAEGTEADVMAADVLMQLQLGAIGKHHAMNALAVLAVCDALSLDMARCATALRRYKEPKGRGTLHKIPFKQGHITLIDESYNASPIAMRAAFARLEAIAASGNHRMVAVLGDMLELGEDSPSLHAGLAEDIHKHHITEVFCVGKLMRHLYDALPEHYRTGYAATNAELAPALLSALQSGDIVLFKGSRGSRVEELLQLVKENAVKVDVS